MTRPDPPPHERAAAERALAAIRAANAATPAPTALRSRLSAARKPVRAPRRRGLAFGLAGALAAAAVLAVLVLPSGTPGGPSVSSAAIFATRPAAEPPPAAVAGRPAVLDREAANVPFPNWAPPFGWRATGARSDRIGGRRVVTVFYEKGGRRIGYTIVEGAGLAKPGGARATIRAGTELRSLRLGRRAVVTWRRAGHTCILVGGPGVHERDLLALASWRDGGSPRY